MDAGSDALDAAAYTATKGMKFTAKIDTRPIGTYYAQLAAVLKQSIPRTVRFEAAATIRRAMQFVTSSKVADVRRGSLLKGVSKFSEDARVGGTTSVGRRSRVFGQQWMVRFDIARVLPMSLWSGKLGPLQDHTGQGWRAKRDDWMRFKTAWAKDADQTREYTKKRLGARGITAQSWFEILTKINSGQTDGVAAFIKRARPVSGRVRQVGFASEQGEGSANFSLTVTNESGLAVKTGGERKLASAITIRRKFFIDSLDKGFFYDAKFVARSYPWARVT